MDISSTSNSSYNRTVTPSKSSDDRKSNDEVQASVNENRAQERAQQRQATQQRLQQYKEESERRLDGRLVSFGQQEDVQNSQQNQVSYNRTRVKEAYSPPLNEVEHSHRQRSEPSPDRSTDAIDIVV